MEKAVKGTFVDVVMCIDATVSMSAIIADIRSNASEFCQTVEKALIEKGKTLEQLRVKVIAFRDFAFDKKPIEESKFFVLPKESDKYVKFLSGIKSYGGGDLPENALEALVLAMKSDWLVGKENYVQDIYMYTDADALMFNERKDCNGYPAGMPEDLKELASWWNNGSEDAAAFKGNLIAFVPDTETWRKVGQMDRCHMIYNSAPSADVTKDKSIVK